MRLVFAGTPQFAAQALERLLDSGYHITLVLTQPDRPAGRGLKSRPSPVKHLATTRQLEVFQPDTLRSVEVLERLRAARPDAIVVAAYGLLLPPAVLDLARFGALNIHASLLPRWRGAAPIQRALLAGDRETGISIMRMDAGLDTGPIILQRSIRIEETDDAGTLHDKLAALGGEAMVSALVELRSGRAQFAPQSNEGATYASKIDKRELWLEWSRPAVELERAVRAYRPAPIAMARVAGEVLRIWQARVVPGTAAPGSVLDGAHLVVACGEQALEILELQRPGGRRMPVEQFVRGHRVASQKPSA